MEQHLSNTIAAYITACASGGDRPTTVRNKQRSLDHFLTVTGNIQTRNVTAKHVDQFFAAMLAKQHQPGTLNNHLFTLRHYFKWCSQRKYRSVADDPTAGRRPFKVPEKRRLIVPRSDFDLLLDSTTHPRDRVVVALGLYLFLRQSEIASLRLSDVDLDEGTVHATIHKTGLIDPMPIAIELDRELRRWLAWYAADGGPLQGDMYLCPSRRGPKFTGGGRGVLVPVGGDSVRPMSRMGKVEGCAQRALERAGYPIRDEEGKSTMEGIHTLRRSGARALFDELVNQRGYDGAGRLVQAMLHHKSFTMTERYLQINLERKRRDEILRGRPMFTPVDMANVITLRKDVQ